MTELDDIIRRALSSFANESLDSDWRGRREREAVSLFVFGHLLPETRPDSVLHDPAQISIEFPVPQVEVQQALSGRVGSKSQVCKDIVIWPAAAMTCWDDADRATVAPAAILEWKFGVRSVFQPDVDWLQAFSTVYPSCIGYAVAANRPGGPFLVDCARVAKGKAQPDWLRL